MNLAVERLKIFELILDKRFLPVWLIFAYFLFIYLFVGLGGNFPLNDDWSYGEGVHEFLRTGHLVMPTVCAAGFTHVFLGAFICKILGFSYVVLRSIMFVLGFIGTLALYAALREAGIHRNTATFCAFVYAANPLSVNLYFSFMSDMTALTLINIYLFLLLRAIRRNSMSIAIGAIAIYILAIGARQSAIIFLPCNLALLFFKSTNRKLLYSLLMVSIVVPLFSYFAMDQWLISRNFSVNDYLDVKEGHLQFVRNAINSPLRWFYDLVVALGQSACYLALFCLPVLLSYILKTKRILTKHISYFPLFLAASIVLLSAIQLVFVQAKFMPFNQNLLRLPIICALTIMGISMPALSKRTLKWLTGLSFFSAFVLLTIVGNSLQKLSVLLTSKKNFKTIKAIFWVSVISTLVSIFFSTVETIVRCTDRYYLIALSPTLLTLAITARFWQIKIVRPLSLVALVLMAFHSACAAQDYLGWNRARWVGIERLEKKGVSSAQIDGGYEYNILRDIKIYSSANRGRPPQNNWRWWPIKGENYIVSFSPIPGYKTIDSIPYWSALTFSKINVLVLEREQ